MASDDVDHLRRGDAGTVRATEPAGDSGHQSGLRPTGVEMPVPIMPTGIEAPNGTQIEDRQIAGIRAAMQAQPTGESLDEQEVKRLRRKLNNRESARRSRQKKADEITRLNHLVKQKDNELEQCRHTVAVLKAHMRSLVQKVKDVGGNIEPAILECLGPLPGEPQSVPDAYTAGSQQGGPAGNN
jgi:hypothetical protein